MLNANDIKTSFYTTVIILIGIVVILFKSSFTYSYDPSDFVKYHYLVRFPKNENIPYLIGIGYWKNPQNPQLPDPTKIVTTYKNSTIKDKIVNYLKKASIFVCTDGFSFCRFQNCEVDRWQMGTDCLTDGKYLWPSGFHHYIQDHNVSIPKEFISHMENNGWEPPSNPDLSKYGKERWKTDFHGKYLAKHSVYMNSN